MTRLHVHAAHLSDFASHEVCACSVHERFCQAAANTDQVAESSAIAWQALPHMAPPSEIPSDRPFISHTHAPDTFPSSAAAQPEEERQGEGPAVLNPLPSSSAQCEDEERQARGPILSQRSHEGANAKCYEQQAEEAADFRGQPAGTCHKGQTKQGQKPRKADAPDLISDDADYATARVSSSTGNNADITNADASSSDGNAGDNGQVPLGGVQLPPSPQPETSAPSVAGSDEKVLQSSPESSYVGRDAMLSAQGANSSDVGCDAMLSGQGANSVGGQPPRTPLAALQQGHPAALRPPQPKQGTLQQQGHALQPVSGC